MTTTRFADHLLTGIHSARPAASAVPAGTLYACSTHGLVYQSDGSSTWSTWATLGATETLPATIIDAKGDLIAGTAADTAARLAVGTDGFFLKADSGQTTGLAWAAAGGSGAMSQLYATTLGSAGTFDQSGLAGSASDTLKLEFIVRGARSGTTDSLQVRFNNDSGANYDNTLNEWFTGTPTNTGATAQTSAYVADIPASTATASLFSIIEILIPGYASTSWEKVGTIRWAWPGGGGLFMGLGSVRWHSTAAITRVQAFGALTANLVTGSLAKAYRIQ